MTSEPLYPVKTMLQQALDIYRDAVCPFAVRCMSQIKGMSVEDAIAGALSDRREPEFRRAVRDGEKPAGALEIADIPWLVRRRWNVFAQDVGDDHDISNQMWAAANARNKVAHPRAGDIDADYAQARLWDVVAVLEKIGAKVPAKQVSGIREQITAAATGAAPQPPAADAAPIAEDSRGQAANGLKPWMAVAPPNDDIKGDTLSEADFAASLQDVHSGRADATQYGNPVSFFEHTYITPGMQALLLNALRRFAGRGGDPVIQTRTGFGGGKTHSLIALYHLIGSTAALAADSSPIKDDIRALAEQAGADLTQPSVARAAVLDGTWLAATDSTTTATGDPLNTLWGEMAYQLGGQEAYDVIGEAARGGTAPGGKQIESLFQHIDAPCAILIDEPVAYVRNLSPEDRDRAYTFFQALTQAVRGEGGNLLVVSLPDQVSEAGDLIGNEVLQRLAGILGRTETLWDPLALDESFEVVRRRLFGTEIDAAERSRTVGAYVRMYKRARSDFPAGVTETNYQRRMEQCYPIHPEVFDRLHNDWSSLQKFQRTRGVLRLLANCVGSLYRSGDSSPLIMPGDMPFRDTAVGGELAGLLSGNWDPALAEIDGENSRTTDIDRNEKRFGEAGGAARRIARTVFLGSAPSGAQRGLDERYIHLGAMRPGYGGVAVYTDALRRMAGSLHYLYAEAAGDRYAFRSEENLNKVSADRRDAIGPEDLDAAVVQALKRAVGRPGPGVVVAPPDSASVPDAPSLQLVILPPGKPLPSRTGEADAAQEEALDMLENCGARPRVHRNSLVFLAARNDDVRGVRRFTADRLAWDSIVTGNEHGAQIPDLDSERGAQAAELLRRASDAERDAIVKAWRQCLAPTQEDPGVPAFRLASFEATAQRGQIAADALAELASGEALVRKLPPQRLADLMVQYGWQNEYHIGISQVWEMLTRNVYMYRLASDAVLDECIRGGVLDGQFGYADGVGAGDEAYRGLRWREQLGGMLAGSLASGLLIHPDMAADEAAKRNDTGTQAPLGGSAGAAAGGTVRRGDEERPPPLRGHTRIVARTSMSGDIDVGAISALRDAVVRNISDDGGAVEVSITVQGSNDGGFSEHTIRAVRENASHLDGIDVEFADGDGGA